MKRKEVRVRVTFDPIDFAVDLFIALILLWGTQAGVAAILARFVWWKVSATYGTEFYGFIGRTAYRVVPERNYYRVFSITRDKTRALLEFDIDADGRRIDYLKLDAFWGHVARPLIVEDWGQDGATL